jgi:hypothetical protein
MYSIFEYYCSNYPFNNTKSLNMNRYISFLVALTISITSFSQDFESGDLKKKNYVRAGLSTPTWQYYGYSNANELKAGLNAETRIGGIFEIGTIFMLNGINVGNNMRFGINADFVSFKTQIFNKPGSENIYNFFVGSKIGPSFTYAPSKAIAFDVFVKLNPVWAAAIYNNHQEFDNGIDMYYGYVQMMYSAGINIKLAIIMLGFEYDFGGLKLKNNKEGNYWPDYSNPNSKKTPMHGFNVTFGFCF